MLNFRLNSSTFRMVSGLFESLPSKRAACRKLRPLDSIESLENRTLLTSSTSLIENFDEATLSYGSGNQTWTNYLQSDPNTIDNAIDKNQIVRYTNSIGGGPNDTLNLKTDVGAPDGALAITSHRDTDPNSVEQYISGEIRTKQAFYPDPGHALHIEARIKLPGAEGGAGIGAFPAFWLVGEGEFNESGLGWPLAGEMDVMEYAGSRPEDIQSGLHGPPVITNDNSSFPAYGFAATSSLLNDQAFYSAYHTFAVDWSANLIQFSVDGVVYSSYTPASVSEKGAWVFDHPSNIILNLSVGGMNQDGDPGFEQAPTSESVFPQVMLVDYVHVNQVALPVTTSVTIDRFAPTQSTTNASSVSYKVTFGQSVQGVDPGDFALALTGVTTQLPVSVTGSGQDYVVTITGISGNGTLGLNLNPSFLIETVDGAPVGGISNGGEIGQVYTINQNRAPVFTSTATPSVVEDQIAVLSVNATDADIPAQPVSYSITGGADQGFFSLTAAGALTFQAPPHFGNPLDQNGDNHYEVQITANDGHGGMTVQNLSVSVTQKFDDSVLSPVFDDVTWTKKQSPIIVLPNLTVENGVNFSGGSLTVSVIRAATKKKPLDQFVIPSTSTIGTATQQSTPSILSVTIDLGANVTSSEIQTFLHGITFSTKGAGLRKATRSLSVSLESADPHISGSVIQTIHVQRKASRR